MTTRRRFTAAFKANVAQGARRGDKKIQEIVSRQKVHSNQVSAWKRQAMDVWELLRNLEIMRPDQGWVIYIAYIRLRPGTIRMPGELRTAVTVLYRTCCPSPAPLDGGGCTVHHRRVCKGLGVAKRYCSIDSIGNIFMQY